MASGYEITVTEFHDDGAKVVRTVIILPNDHIPNKYSVVGPTMTKELHFVPPEDWKGIASVAFEMWMRGMSS